MPTKREREYYQMGFRDGLDYLKSGEMSIPLRPSEVFPAIRSSKMKANLMSQFTGKRKPKRKLSAWNKFVKANSRKKEFRYANGKLKLKKMGIAFRRKQRR